MTIHRTARFGLGPRQQALAGALACVLAAAAYAVGMSESPLGPSSINPSGAATDPARGTGTQSSDVHFAADRNWAEKLRRTPIEVKSGGSLFDSRSWTPPPAAPIARSAPSVPPFPFHYMGKLVLDGGDTTFYLTRGDEIFSVKPGTVIAGNYRVDKIEANMLEVTYLPLDRKQNVSFSSILPPARAEGNRIGMSGGNNPVTLSQVIVNPPADGTQAASPPPQK